jgi:hypothetical protein
MASFSGCSSSPSYHRRHAIQRMSVCSATELQHVAASVEQNRVPESCNSAQEAFLRVCARCMQVTLLGAQILAKHAANTLHLPFVELPSVRVHKRNLLKAWVLIASYNDHCPAPSPEPLWLVQHHQSLLGPGSRHCYEINYTQNPRSGVNECYGE